MPSTHTTATARGVGWQLLAVLVAACSGGPAASGEERVSSGDPAAAERGDSEESPLADDDQPECIPGTGSSPWSHSVPDEDTDPQACTNTTHPPGPPCEQNSDCGICHDGSSCGRAANREEIERLGSQCCQEDAAECEPFVVRCCSGHCRITGD